MFLFLVQILTTIENIPRSTGEVFTELYREFLPKVFRYVSYRVNDAVLAEDLTSAVFEKALVKFSSYSQDRGAFSTWIFSIARNTIIDHFRTSKQARMVSLDNAATVADGDPTPEDDAVKNAEIRHLQDCMANLPQSQREIIALKFGAEMTNRQIAKKLGISESNVGTILYRVVRKLREDYGVNWNG